MKTIYIVLMMLLSTTILQAQELPCKAKYWNERCKERYREDSDGNKHGKYILYNEDGVVLATGNFVHGVQQGNWKYTTNEDDAFWFIIRGITPPSHYYVWHERGVGGPRNPTPIASREEAHAIAKKWADAEKKAEADRKAEEEAKKKAQEEAARIASAENERLAKLRAAEAARIEDVRQKILYRDNVSIDHLIEAVREGVLGMDEGHLKSLKRFFEGSYSLSTFNLSLRNKPIDDEYRKSDAAIIRAAVFNYIKQKINVDLAALKVEPYSEINMEKIGGSVRVFSFSGYSQTKGKEIKVLALKYNDAITVLRQSEADNKDNGVTYIVTPSGQNSNFQQADSDREVFLKLSETERYHVLIEYISLLKLEKGCMSFKDMDVVLGRSQFLQPENEEGIAKFVIEILDSYDGKGICDVNTALEGEATSMTYRAYMSWLIGDTEKSKKLFTGAKSKGATMEKYDSSQQKWIKCSYSDFLGYYHKEWVETANKKLKQDGNLKKLVKSI